MERKEGIAVQKNYHTHTPRCHHAKGTEREYIERAIAAGFTTLGFADHTPQLFGNGYTPKWRMLPEDLRDYTDTLVALREEYRDKIEILIGLETEYYPDIFGDLMDFLKDYPMDYLILGQHTIDNESIEPAWYSGRSDDVPFDEKLTAYVERVVAGIGTGKFAYVAHPDVITPFGDPKHYDAEMRRLCVAAKERDIPLEINMLGLADHRHYPHEPFWKIAGEVGNTAILGCDAHTPEMIPNVESQKAGEALAAKYHIPITEDIRLTLR